jgi:hypothetical protein
MALKIYQIKLESTFLGEVAYNIFNYTSADQWLPEELVVTFLANVLTPFLGISHDGLEYTSITASDARGGPLPDYYATLQNWTGTRAGPEAPSFQAWGYFMQRGSRNVGSGGKRFGGVAENDTEGQDPVGSFLNNLTANAPFLASVLVNDGEKFPPIIYRAIDIPTGGTEQAAQVVAGQYRRLTTQNSRKKGHGNASGFTVSANDIIDFSSFTPEAGWREQPFSQWVSEGGLPFYVDGTVAGEPNVVLLP